MAMWEPSSAETLRHLACSLAALNPAPWPKVKKMSRLCPGRPKTPTDYYTLDQRSQEAILALGLYELQSNLQYKSKIMPYLIDVLKNLPAAKWIEPQMFTIASKSPISGEFTLCFVSLMSSLARKDNLLAGKINKAIMDVFEILVKRLCPGRPKTPTDYYTLDQRSQEAILALGLYELQSNLQYKSKIMPYLIDVLKNLPAAKWIEPQMFTIASKSPISGEFTLCFVSLMSSLARKDNLLAGEINKAIMDVFEILVKRCWSYKEMRDIDNKGKTGFL
ncbi:Phosphatidylinositol 4-kinase alpha [Exaiptasia diaphana]|nr:Phosphatidylinositol 4-kinase alpha [Exaiptasia diaphana]